MKVIYIYASRCGGCGKVAFLLRHFLKDEIQTVNIAKEVVPDITEFDIILLGSGIYYGKLHPLIEKYLTSASKIIKTIPTIFITCNGEQDNQAIEADNKKILGKYYDYFKKVIPVGGRFRLKENKLSDILIMLIAAIVYRTPVSFDHITPARVYRVVKNIRALIR